MTSRTVLNKAAALALLVAALALPHPTPSRVRVVLFAFGAFNVLVPVPGALLVRIISTLCTLGALVSSDEIAGGMLIMSLLFWPPLVMVAWAFSRERARRTRHQRNWSQAVAVHDERSRRSSRPSPSRRWRIRPCPGTDSTRQARCSLDSPRSLRWWSSWESRRGRQPESQ